jgi:hypothetical protein
MGDLDESKSDGSYTDWAGHCGDFGRRAGLLCKGAATTEDLRTAMIQYRSLLEELVQVPTSVEMKAVA